MNTVQFKILNRKCSFLIQLNPIESKKKYSLFKIRIRIEKNFNPFSFAGLLSQSEITMEPTLGIVFLKNISKFFKSIKNFTSVKLTKLKINKYHNHAYGSQLPHFNSP